MSKELDYKEPAGEVDVDPAKVDAQDIAIQNGGDIEVSPDLNVESTPVDISANVADAPMGDDPVQDKIDQTQVDSSSQIANKCIPSQMNPLSISLENQLLKSRKNLESMVLKYAKSERENLLNKSRVEELNKKLQRAIKDNEQLANRIKLLTNDKTHLTDTLNAKVAQLTVLEQKNLQFNNVQDTKLRETEGKLKTLEETNEELLKQIESYKSKEGELLDFSERLSMKHMMLQTELDEALKKVPSYKEEYELVVKQNQELLAQLKEQETQIKDLSKSLDEEKNVSAELRVAKEELETSLRNTSDDLQNEIKVMRRKHQTALKELTRQIKHLQTTMKLNSANHEFLGAS